MADRAAFVQLAEVLPAAPEVDYLVRRGTGQLTVKGPHPQPALIGSVIVNSAAYAAEIAIQREEYQDHLSTIERFRDMGCNGG